MDINEENVPPEEVSKLLKQEPYDFVVKSSKAFPASKSLFFVVFGVLPLIINFDFFSQATLNIIPFILISLSVAGYGVYLFFVEGSWYIGTPKGLVMYRKKQMKIVDWEQFSGTIGISGTAEKGSITLLMKTGRMISRNYSLNNSYIPDVIYIIGIKNAFHISESIRKRIKDGSPIKLNIV